MNQKIRSCLLYFKKNEYRYFLQICDMLKTGGTRHWIPEMEVPYVVKNDQWVGYDDPESLKKKVIFMKKLNHQF